MKKRSARPGLIAGILCLAAAAAWHSLDMRAGIHETGASWQMGQYLFLTILVVALIHALRLFPGGKTDSLFSVKADCADGWRAWHPVSLCSAAPSPRRMRSATTSVLTAFPPR